MYIFHLGFDLQTSFLGDIPIASIVENAMHYGGSFY